MIKNLQERGLCLETILDYPDISSQKARYQTAGYPAVITSTMNEYYDQCLDIIERKRLKTCEFLDEFEEFRLFGHHYMTLMAKKL